MRRAAGIIAVALAAVPSAAGAAPGPAGCAPERAGVSHGPGGQPATGDRRRALPIPCLSTPAYDAGAFTPNAGEPTLGVTDAGTILFQTYDLPDAPRLPSGGVIRSRDGGHTWSDVSPRLPNGERSHQESVDPYLHVDRGTGRVFTTDLLSPPPAGCVQVSFSDDEGSSWSESIGGCSLNDHQTLFTGPPARSTTVGYPNVVYLCAIQTRFQLVTRGHTTGCEKSLDGGRSFAPTGLPAFSDFEAGRDGETDYGLPGHCGGPTGHGNVGPDGTVYLPRGWCGQPWIAISRDEGATWERVQVASNGMARSPVGISDHEAGVAVDGAGHLYYTWVARDRLPYLAISRDAGRTWSEPMMIAPPGVREAALPGIAPAPGQGLLAVVYMGSTNSPGPPFKERDTCVLDAPGCLEHGFEDLTYGLRDGYEEVTFDGYLTVFDRSIDEHPVFWSVRVNDPADPLVRGDCGPVRCREQLDFLDVVMGADGTPWASFVDGCPPGCVAQDGLHQPAPGMLGAVVWPRGKRRATGRASFTVATRPRSLRRGRSTRVRFHVRRRGGGPLRGAVIRMNGRRATTGPRGRAVIVTRPRERGDVRVVITAPGGESVTLTMDVRRRG